MVEYKDHQRMLERDKKPSRAEMVGFIGVKAETAWNELLSFMKANYDIEPETVFYGTNYGWLVRYRKSNKTLCSFFPERNSFTFLITYGKKEIEKYCEQRDEFSKSINELFDNTKQLHDGRWLFIRVVDKELVNEIKKLISIKRKPKKK